MLETALVDWDVCALQQHEEKNGLMADTHTCISKQPVLTALSTYASVHTVSCSWSMTFGRLMT